MAGVERAYDTLRPGTEVDAYVIRKILGAGGFGVTYLAEHRRLGKEFAIKEFFPRAFAFRDGVTVNPRTGGEETYSWGLDRFLQEARALAKFHHHAIVGVSNVFEANGTAYMVLSFEHGQDMRDWLAGLKRVPSQTELDSIVSPLLDALAVLHGSGLLHRDIAPDNIFIRTDGSPLLLDFGAARSALSEHSAQMSAIVKTGYSPPEQYTTEGRDQGPWSDIYAFGATLYWAVTGELPPESTARTLTDRYVPAARKAKDKFRQPFLTAIDDALKVSPGQRPRSIVDWRQTLEAKDPIAVIPVPVAVSAPKPVLAHTPSVATFVAPPPAPVPAHEPRADEAIVLAPIDLGPGVERKPSVAGKLVRLALKAVAIFVALLGVVLLIGYCAGPGSRVSQGAPVNVATAIADCDRLASIPYDPSTKAREVELIDVNAARAISTCSAAAASADATTAPRIKAQLGYAFYAAGKFKEAAEAYAASAGAGYAEAMGLHAELLLEGLHPVTYDPAAGCKLAERAVTSGSTVGRIVFANCMNSGYGGYGRDPGRAASLFREASARGHPVGMYSLGIMLRDGAGVPRDTAQALKLFEEAHGKGDPRGSYLLGQFYAGGEGLPKDEGRSAEFYRRAYAGLEKRAAANEVDGQRLVALMLLRGTGVAKDARRAVAMMEAAAMRGSRAAMETLGSLYDEGDVVTRDYDTSLKWRRSAAALDGDTALNDLGVMHQEGHGVGVDLATAMRYYLRAAALGHAVATFNVGEMFYYGRGVNEDFVTALTWYRRAADLGNGSAMQSIGVMMEAGRGTKQNFAEARRWFLRGAEVGDAGSMNSLGDMHKEGKGTKKDPAEALNWYRKAADLGDAEAMANMGVMYRDGEGVTRDPKAALNWFRRAADKRHARGTHLLGDIYLLGRGVEVDYREALKWIKISADQDYPEAISDLGVMYLRGYGVPENPTEAFRLFTRAAELGYATAMHNLASLYETARGVAKNCTLARTWYTKALEAGFQDSKKALAELNKSKC